MHLLQLPAVRRVGGLASLAVVGLALSAATSLPVGAQSAPAASSCPSGPPVLQLGNPNPGDLLPTGDIVFSGVAFDPAATSRPGITSVDLFLGSRDTGGVFLGSAVPGTSATSPNAWQITANLPSGINGGRDFFAYATSSLTGQQTSIDVPVFVGAQPTPTPVGNAPTPVPLSETTTSTCSGAATTTTAPGPAAPVASPPATAAAGPQALLQLPGTHAPVLSVANPTADNLVPAGDLIVEGEAFDPSATSGSGIDSVELFLGSRESGGISVGSGVPGDNGAPNPRTFVIKANIPSNVNGEHDFVVYARSAATGEETVVSSPVFVGLAPTPTPRPHS
jgi:hypothetical protein